MGVYRQDRWRHRESCVCYRNGPTLRSTRFYPSYLQNLHQRAFISSGRGFVDGGPSRKLSGEHGDKAMASVSMVTSFCDLINDRSLAGKRSASAQNLVAEAVSMETAWPKNSSSVSLPNAVVTDADVDNRYRGSRTDLGMPRKPAPRWQPAYSHVGTTPNGCRFPQDDLPRSGRESNHGNSRTNGGHSLMTKMTKWFKHFGHRKDGLSMSRKTSTNNRMNDIHLKSINAEITGSDVTSLVNKSGDVRILPATSDQAVSLDFRTYSLPSLHEGGLSKCCDQPFSQSTDGLAGGQALVGTDQSGPSSGLSAAIHQLLRRDPSEISSSSLSPEGSTVSDSRLSLRSRRMSTPHPIRSRVIQSLYHAPTFHTHLKRAHSSPDFIDYDNVTMRAHRKQDIFRVSLSTAGDLAIQSQDYSSDEDSDDSLSYGLLSIGSTLSLRQQIFEAPTYAEALWDHVTMDPEELGFRAGDVIRVTEMRDRNWWFGQIADKEGWFPASFVRLRVNQVEIITEDPSILVTPSQKSRESVSQSQARTNVVREIVQAEKEYVKHVKDVIQGYLEKCEKRPEMFPPEKISAIFSNIIDIYNFSVKFSKDLEQNLNVEEPHQSKLGKVFINHRNGFKIYSEYCNNHPTAQNELRILQKNKKYTHFFEACRLLQDMINLPLECFLLAPVQKICKYPLQLRELLKYTPQTHEDYEDIKVALDTMHGIAVMINERKRKMESIEKLAQWQLTVEDWQGPDLLDKSSELIYSGEMTKVNSYGIRQDRMFFLFDHQLIYCKKELLWRDMLVYKGRIDLDNCVIKVIADGRDQIFNINVKNAIRICDNTKSKWYLVYCRSAEERRRWFAAFQQERDRIEEDRRNGFNLAEFRSKARLPENKGAVKSHTARYREQGKKNKKKHVEQTKAADRQPFVTNDDATTPDMTEDTQRRWPPIFRKVKR